MMARVSNHTKWGILVAGVVSVFLGYLLFTHTPSPTNSGTPVLELNSQTATLLPPRTPPSGFEEYRNTTYRFSLFYPSGMEVTEFDEGGGASTITFQNTGEVKGFQIFIVPYGAPQVSAERFHKDVPSGVREQSTNLTIDGAVADMFFSKNITLGDTREVWFIKNGYLFEVTTLKSLDAWLTGIIQTWKFI